MGTNSLTEPVLFALTTCLKPRGYVKSGSTFRLRSPEIVSIVSMQSSTSSTSALAKVTINLGIHVLALQDPQRPEKNPSTSSAHWHQRIGQLMPEKNDVWWSIHTIDEAGSVAAEVVRRVEQFGLPALAQVSTVPALQQLWVSGHSPGITDGQRVRYLQQLAEAVAS